MNYDMSKEGYVFLPEWSAWVTEEWLAAFEKAHGRLPETKAEIDDFEFDKLAAYERDKERMRRDKAVQKAASFAVEKAKKPMPPLPKGPIGGKGFAPPRGSKMPGFQVPKRYT